MRNGSEWRGSSNSARTGLVVLRPPRGFRITREHFLLADLRLGRRERQLTRKPADFPREHGCPVPPSWPSRVARLLMNYESDRDLVRPSLLHIGTASKERTGGPFRSEAVPSSKAMRTMRTQTGIREREREDGRQSIKRRGRGSLVYAQIITRRGMGVRREENIQIWLNFPQDFPWKVRKIERERVRAFIKNRQLQALPMARFPVYAMIKGLSLL